MLSIWLVAWPLFVATLLSMAHNQSEANCLLPSIVYIDNNIFLTSKRILAHIAVLKQCIVPALLLP